MKLLVGVLTAHRYDYYIDDLTVEYNKSRCLDQQARVNTQRATWLKSLPPSVDYRFFYGSKLRRLPAIKTQPQLRAPLTDEIFLDCGDGYSSNPEKLKGMCRYALSCGYDFLLRVDDDTYVYPSRLLRLDWQHDYAGANKGSFHPGGCMFLSRRAMELIVNATPTSYADDLWVGQVMSDNRIPMHGIASIHNEFGDGYNVIPENLPIHQLSALHSCKPSAMKYLEEHGRNQ